MIGKFEISDLDVHQILAVTNRHRVAMARVVLGFARFDSRLSDWVVEAFGLRFDRAAMLIKNIGIENKLQRLIKLYDHEGPKSAVADLKRCRKEMVEHYETRNLICHAACLGTWAKDRDYLLFTHLAYRPGDTESNFLIEAISLDGLKAAADWAEDMAHDVMLATHDVVRMRE